MNDVAAHPEVWQIFAGEINNAAFSRLAAHLAGAKQANMARIHLLIQSAGGFVGDGIAMYNLLLNLPVDVASYNAGSVESIALLPYLAGKRRLVSQSATFLIHKTHVQVPGRATGSVLAAAAEAADLHDQNVEAVLRRHLSMPEAKWKVHGERDLLVSATEAVEYGIAHEIADFKPNGPLFNI